MGEVFLVEDDPLLLEHQAWILSKRGHSVRAFPSGGAAMQALREGPPPDLLVVDLGLSDMSGRDLVLWVREQRSRAALPIIVVSGSAGEVAIRDALAAGASDYLVKPVSEAELAAKASVALRRRREFLGAPLTCQFVPGDVAFERWRVAGYLGQGAYGTVYGVRCLKTDASLALKVLRSTGVADRGRFLRECYTLAACQQPGVPAISAYGESEGFFFIACEWVSGVDLAGHLKTKGMPLSEFEALQLVEGVAQTLCVLSQEGIVHRDLKPGNVLLREGRPDDPVLVDFGLAKYVGIGDGLTTQDIVMGTPGFIAPEVVSGAQPECASDIYSLGLLARFGLTGRLPYSGAQGSALILRSAKEEVDMNVGVSPAAVRLLADMSRIDPDQRPTAGEVRERARALSPKASRTAQGGRVAACDVSSTSVAVVPQ